MARIEVVEWLKIRLAPRYEGQLGEVVARRPYKNEIKKVVEKYTNLSKKRLENYTNETENIAVSNSLVQKASGALGRIVNDILPGEAGQVLYEAAEVIAAGTRVILPDGRVGKLVKHAEPGETVDAEIEIGETIVANTEVEIENKVKAKVVSDIAPGQTGEIRWVQYGNAKCPAGMVLGIVESDDNARIWRDFNIERLANLFDSVLPAVLPNGQVDVATYNQMVDVVRATNDTGLIDSFELWHKEGLL